MATRNALVGRRAELERLAQSLDSARQGNGSVLLLAGEAGVGKTRLAEDLAGSSDCVVLWGRAVHGGASPYGPMVAALRSYLRTRPDGLSDCGPLRPHLALLLPELGDPPAATDRPTLFEAVRCALDEIAGERPVLVVLDDLHWSDDATLEMLAALAEPLAEMPLLLIGGYRSDGLPRDHMLRRLRHELRRGGHLNELVLEPFELDETGRLLEEVLGSAPAPSLVRAIQDRTQGVPFFVEELAGALLLMSSLKQGPRGLELLDSEQVPVPDTVRDAVLIGVRDLSDETHAAAEAAAVAGETFDLGLVGELAGAEGLGELLELGLIAEAGDGTGAFRHALAREALYADIPWLRRQALHRTLAERLSARGGRSIEVATHWLGAQEQSRARAALLTAAEESRVLHAYRDATRAGRQALELWPVGEDDNGRLEVLETYARSAELSGELTEAARAWREVCTIHQGAGGGRRLAEAQRRLAGAYDLTGDRGSAMAARASAAEAYAGDGMPAEAATERLAMANYLRASADYSEAIELAAAAGREAGTAERLDLRARALGLEGVARAKRGDSEGGLEQVRAGLALALEHDLTPVAAELYQRLSLVLYDSADYTRARETLDTALDFCRAGDEAGPEVACLTCMVYVLRECGEWQEAVTMGRELIDDGEAVWVAEGLIGAIYAFQGKFGTARRLLSSGLAGAAGVGHFNMTVDATAALAWLAAAEDDHAQAVERCRALLARWEDSEDHHYAVRGLRFGAAYLAQRGELADASACAEALTRIASRSGHPDALAALAQAIGEAALAEGDADTAAEQLSRAVEIHRTLDIPFERAEIALRAGVALAAAGERDAALERLADAYRSARKLGARPVAAEAAQQVAALGESVATRLGSRAEADAQGAGLTRRELEVMRLVAVGRTNREIAQELFLSPRTVDMHVRNILRKLDCRSRVEAAHRAGELGLLV
jgi:DNA-binding CsgD family transcriptional regulator